VAALAGLGLVMLFSTGAYANEIRGITEGSSQLYFFLKRQSLWMGIGLVICVICSMIDYHVWSKLCWPIMGLTIVLLVLCFVPGIAKPENGSNRWLNLRFMSFQPSELAKFSAILFLAWWFTRYELQSRKFFKGFVFPCLIVGVLCALIVIEVDLGATALVGGATLLVMFIAGAPPLFLGAVVCVGVGAVIYAAMHIDERSARLMAFMDLEKYKLEAGLQQWNGLVALGSGGLEGLGLGNGRQKMLYLPYAHTDFIFPMIGEELGLRATLFVVAAYLVILLCGVLIAMHARDRFGMLLGFGLIILIMLQAMVNIGVTTALLPNKGMPLPFISYGGTNLVLCLAFVGILISIHRQGVLDRQGKTRLLTTMAARIVHRV